MRNVPVVAVPVFQHKCSHCGRSSEQFLSCHVCQSCGQPQPLTQAEDYFSAFGLPRRFAIDRKELEKRFYEISRALHPDRFALIESTAGSTHSNNKNSNTHPISSAISKSLSLERMSFLNLAYGTLKSPALLRDYLLQLEGVEHSDNANVGAKRKMQLPMELAESWFELQDLMAEDFERAAEKLNQFAVDLKQAQAAAEGVLARLEKDYDLQPDKGILEKMVLEIQMLSYLKSMEKDIERIKQNAHSN